MIRYSRFTSHDHREPLSFDGFDAEFENILEEFEELQATGITPLVELQQRRGSGSRHMVFEKWIFNTARVLLHMPAPEPRTRERINKLGAWLTQNSGEQRSHVRTAFQDYPPRIKQLMLKSGYWDELPKHRGQYNLGIE